MTSQAQVNQTAIYSSVLLSYATYTDEADTGNEASQIQTVISNITAEANGPWNLTWGPINNMGILAFVAQGADGSYTLALRGTLTDETAAGSWLNVIEDLDITEQVPFPYPFTSGANVAQGSMAALQSLISATDPTTDICLMDYLRQIPATSSGTLTLNVTGHSLGADLANLASAWLADQYAKAQVSNATLSITPYTFAAPMTGDASFATLWSGLFGTASYAAVNQYDVVPMAWTDSGITEILNTYSNGPSLYESEYYYTIYLFLSGIQATLCSESTYPYVSLQPSKYFGFQGWNPNAWGTGSENNDSWPDVVAAEHSVGTYVLAVCGQLSNDEVSSSKSFSRFGVSGIKQMIPPQRKEAAGVALSSARSTATTGNKQEEAILPLTRSSVLIDKETLARWRATGPGWSYRMGKSLAKGPA